MKAGGPIRAKLGPNHEVIPCDRQDFVPWALEHVEKETGVRVVGEFNRGDVTVSTVFGGALGGEQQRYETWEEAERGHAEMVARVVSSLGT